MGDSHHTSSAAAPADAADNHAAATFIDRWQGTTASELATAQSFVIELCQLLGVDRPHPTPAQDYMFERPITFWHGDGASSSGRIDCYKPATLQKMLAILWADMDRGGFCGALAKDVLHFNG